ncbi:MAG: family 78 glycoside hydrolase catalytic domain [Schaedlerella sp.]
METYKPKFTFHGFRYIEISGVDTAPALGDVQGILLSSVPEITGMFECGNPLVNKLVSNVSYSQRCNFISIPTDCPQRNERMGWTGDTHVFCRAATYQSQIKNFYLRNLQAMKDLQEENGRLPNIAPFGGGFGGITYESAMILMCWELYQQYGDFSVVAYQRLLCKNRPSFCKNGAACLLCSMIRSFANRILIFYYRN